MASSGKADGADLTTQDRERLEAKQAAFLEMKEKAKEMKEKAKQHVTKEIADMCRHMTKENAEQNAKLDRILQITEENPLPKPDDEIGIFRARRVRCQGQVALCKVRCQLKAGKKLTSSGKADGADLTTRDRERLEAEQAAFLEMKEKAKDRKHEERIQKINSHTSSVGEDMKQHVTKETADVKQHMTPAEEVTSRSCTGTGGVTGRGVETCHHAPADHAPAHLGLR